ncbi:hypothetical protein [Pseudonocardia sp. GCM10023141]|uniref:hypothetical protein n=1 Tax=Pseudonocardia sp. GCM10023141 TaxID=3252653 RepID=UPI00361D8CAE
MNRDGDAEAFAAEQSGPDPTEIAAFGAAFTDAERGEHELRVQAWAEEWQARHEAARPRAGDRVIFLSERAAYVHGDDGVMRRDDSPEARAEIDRRVEDRARRERELLADPDYARAQAEYQQDAAAWQQEQWRSEMDLDEPRGATEESERRAQLARWHADDQAAAVTDGEVSER